MRWALRSLTDAGHGKSGGDTRAYIPYWQPVVNDALFAIETTHKFFGPIPKFLFGYSESRESLFLTRRFIRHSMGGALAILTAQKRPAGFEWNGVILSAPALQKVRAYLALSDSILFV